MVHGMTDDKQINVAVDVNPSLKPSMQIGKRIKEASEAMNFICTLVA